MNKLTKALLNADFDLNKIDSSKFGAKDLETFLFLKENRKKIIESSTNKIVKSSDDAVNAILNKKNMAALDVEEFGVVCMNRQNEIIDISILFKGGRSSCIADYKVIYKHLLDVKASSFIMFHNHPSGKLNPSQADIDLTNKGKKNAELLDLSMLDSLIISNGGSYFSFADEGFLKN